MVCLSKTWFIPEPLHLLAQVCKSQRVIICVKQLGGKPGEDFSLITSYGDKIFAAEIANPLSNGVLGDLVDHSLHHWVLRTGLRLARGIRIRSRKKKDTSNQEQPKPC